MKKFLYPLLFVSVTFFTFSCSSDDDVISANGTETAQKYSKVIQVSNQEGNASLDLRLSSYDQEKLQTFLDSYEYILTKESIIKSSEATVLEQELTDRSVTDNSISYIETEVISSIPDGYVITIQEKTPNLRYAIAYYALKMEVLKTCYGNGYLSWGADLYCVPTLFIGWVGHPQNGICSFKYACFDPVIFGKWRVY